jgi:hypothetical protein
MPTKCKAMSCCLFYLDAQAIFICLVCKARNCADCQKPKIDTVWGTLSIFPASKIFVKIINGSQDGNADVDGEP